MRALAATVLVLAVACTHTSSSEDCPTLREGSTGGAIESTPCTLPATQQCFGLNTFSGCASAWYRCVNGKWKLDHSIDAREGASCSESPLTSCSYEGNPGCMTQPHSRSCGCDANGTWKCTCSCYDGTDCTCPAVYQPLLEGIACGAVGNDCTWPGHTCTCVDDPVRGEPTFRCN